MIGKQVIAVKVLQTLLFDFGVDTRPALGHCKITSKGSDAQKTGPLSFADVSNSHVLERSPQAGAGTLPVTSVKGFLYVSTRNVLLKPSGLSHTGECAKPMTLGFEGAINIR